MAEARLMGCQNLPGGEQSHLQVGQGADIAARGCKVATYQPMKLRQSGRLKVRDQFTKFRIHQDSPRRVLRAAPLRGTLASRRSETAALIQINEPLHGEHAANRSSPGGKTQR
jgi:hypothetical protein